MNNCQSRCIPVAYLTPQYDGTNQIVKVLNTSIYNEPAFTSPDFRGASWTIRRNGFDEVIFREYQLLSTPFQVGVGSTYDVLNIPNGWHDLQNFYASRGVNVGDNDYFEVSIKIRNGIGAFSSQSNWVRIDRVATTGCSCETLPKRFVLRQNGIDHCAIVKNSNVDHCLIPQNLNLN